MKKRRSLIRQALLERVSLEEVCRIFSVSMSWLLQFIKNQDATILLTNYQQPNYEPIQVGSMLKQFFIFLIRLYQWTISPLLGSVCCFHPSCSEYMIQALAKHGLMRGGWLGIKRLLRCRPGQLGGSDPVP